MVRPRTRLGRWAHHVRCRIEFALYRACAWLVQILPLRASRVLGAWVGRFLFFSGSARRIARANFAVAFPDAGADRADVVLVEAAESSGRGLMDLLRSERWTHAAILERVSFEGVDHIKEALSEGHGVIALLPHLGNYELAIRAAPVIGFNLAVVSRALHNPYVQRHMAAQRVRTGGVLIPHRQALPQILRHLRAGHVVAILNDQYSKRAHGILAPFFGAQAWTSPGPALAAIRAGAPIVPCCMLSDGHDHQTLHFHAPLRFERSGDLRADLARLTAAMNEAMEDMIRAHPEQWLWTHRRFRHSPDLPKDLYRA